MSVALGALTCSMSGCFLAAVMWRDRLELLHHKNLEQRKRFTELSDRRAKRLEQQEVEYRPMSSSD